MTIMHIAVDGTITRHLKTPKAGDLQGAHALLGRHLDVCSLAVDRTLVMWVGGDSAHLDLPVNQLAWLLYGRSKIHGPVVIGRDDQRPMTGGQCETVNAVGRTLEFFGWERAVDLAGRFVRQEAGR